MPSAAVFDHVLAGLRRILTFELRRRGLWRTPPRYLGIFGGAAWADPVVLDELALDCYSYVFVDRLRGLRRQAAKRESIDGLVTLSVRHFVHDSQRRYDPLGYRVFELVHAAATALIDEGALSVVAGDERIRNRTVLSFTPDTSQRPHTLHRRTVVAWNDRLMPGLVTAWHRGSVVDELVECMRGLQSVEPFQFHDVVQPLKEDARLRWHALVGSPEGEGESGSLGLIVRPEVVGFEAREQFRALSRCIRLAIDDESSDPLEREQLSRMFDALVETSAAFDEGAPPPAPSLHGLASALALSRRRTRHLRSLLEALAVACARERPGATDEGRPITPDDSALSEGEMAMDTRELLRRRTLNALQVEDASLRSDLRGVDVPAAAGDVMVFADDLQPIEWLWLSGNAEHARLVPVDQAPFHRSNDVAVLEIEGERIVIRPSIAASVSSVQLARATRTFTLPAEMLRRVRQLAIEVDPKMMGKSGEPSSAHRDWLDGLSAAARHLERRDWAAPSRTLSEVSIIGSRARSAVFASWLAAAFAFVALGLGWRLWQLDSNVDRGEPPHIVQTDRLQELRLGSRDRAEEVLHIEVDGHLASLYLVLRDLPSYSRYRLRLRREGVDGSSWSSAPFGKREQQLHLPVGETSVRWQLEILGLGSDGKEAVLDTQSVVVVPILSSR